MMHAEVADFFMSSEQNFTQESLAFLSVAISYTDKEIEVSDRMGHLSIMLQVLQVKQAIRQYMAITPFSADSHIDNFSPSVLNDL